MYFRITATIVLIALVNFLISCSAKTLISLEEAEKKSKKTVSSVALNSGEMVTFEKGKGNFDVNTRTISGVAIDDTGRKTAISLDFDDVRAVQGKKFSPLKTTLLVVGVCATALAIFVIAVAAGGGMQ